MSQPIRTVPPVLDIVPLVLDVLLPHRCVLCRRAGPGLCAACATDLPPPSRTPLPLLLDQSWALLSYESSTTRLVAELKFRNHRDAFATIGRAMSVFVSRSAVPVDLVTWAPTSPARRRRRGYDQAAVLAAAVAHASTTPAFSTLRRLRGPPQTGADRAHRLRGPSFEPTTHLAGHVVVVDDVCTTGATLTAAASALRHAGAERVSGLVLAATP